MIVVKLGGSLYDHPALGPGLQSWLSRLGQEHVLIVPGGGPTADTVRRWDRVHDLGDTAAHWLAIRSMSLAAAFLEQLLPGTAVVGHPNGWPDPGCGVDRPVGWAPPTGSAVMGGAHPTPSDHERVPPTPSPAVRILDAFEFCRTDDTLPHSWDVTSDSIAAWAAAVVGASRLVLLKSVDVPPGCDWRTAAANGWVDPYFPRAVAEARFGIEAVNFRRWLGSARAAQP